jgi:hypothetical protein
VQRFVASAPEVFELGKFCNLFIKLHFFSLKVTEFVGENTNFLGLKGIYILLVLSLRVASRCSPYCLTLKMNALRQ